MCGEYIKDIEFGNSDLYFEMNDNCGVQRTNGVL